MPIENILSEDLINKIKSLYDDGLNRINIAKQLSLTEWTVRKCLKGYCKNKSERLKRYHRLNSIQLSDLQIQCILGTLLGDASLSYRQKTDCFEYQLSHCKEQKEYIEHISQLLNVKCNKYIKNDNSFSSGKEYYKLSYHNKYELVKLAQHTINNGRKTITKEWVNLLQPIAIAYWFMDDGSSSWIKNNPGIMVRFSTLSFTKDEISLLQNKLLEFGIETVTHNHTDGTGHELYIRQKSVNIFMNLVEPFVVNCMKYKIKRRLNG